MTFSQWKKMVFKTMNNQPIPVYTFTEKDFPTVDFHKLYCAGLSFAQAGEVAKSINRLTKDNFF